MPQSNPTSQVPEKWTQRVAACARKAITILQGYPWHEDPNRDVPSSTVVRLSPC